MFGFYISLPFLLFALYRLIVVLINYISRPFLAVGKSIDNSFVSVMIYLQNSEKTIGTLIQGLKDQEYQNIEVLIYNDQTTDRSVGVIGEIVAGDKRFRLFNGSDVQSGWQRKNYSYDKLTQIAKGQYYIFIDSNVIVDNQFVANAVFHMQQKSLSLMTIYPKSKPNGFYEKVKTSAKNWLLFSLVSVKSFFKKSSLDDFKFFENPLIVIDNQAYLSGKWYEQYKDVTNPEIKIATTLRDQGRRGEMILGDNRITISNSCNKQAVDVVEGLIQNRKAIIGLAAAVILSPVLIIFLMPFSLVFLYLFFVIYGNMLVALICHESILLNLLLLPVQFILLSISLIKSVLKK